MRSSFIGVQPNTGPATVIGGLNMDIQITSRQSSFERGTSNPATVRFAPGGVGRNIAENLARIGVEVCLLAAVGDDPVSDRLLDATRSSGVDVSGTMRLEGRACGLYVALMTAAGELDTGASDMTIMDEIDIGFVERNESVIGHSGVVICDTNIRGVAIQRVLDIANSAGVPVIVDPVSAVKADRLAGLSGDVFAVTPDAMEAPAVARAKRLTVAHTVVTLGREGVSWTDNRNGVTRKIPARKVEVTDVTGAGDAFVAGLGAALMAGRDMPGSLRIAADAAAEVVSSPATTLSQLSGERIAGRLRGRDDG